MHQVGGDIAPLYLVDGTPLKGWRFPRYWEKLEITDTHQEGSPHPRPSSLQMNKQV